MDPITGAVIGNVVGAGIGAIGSSQAANAQERMAKQAAEIQRRNMLMAIQAQEPARYTGYQALGDINNVFGYQSAPYTTGNQLMQTLTPIKSRDVVKLMRQGMTPDQIGQYGTLGGKLDPKAVKRLTRAGLTMEQIQGLSANRPMAAPAPTGSTSQQQPAGPTGLAAFQASPDYQFRLNEGTRNIGNSFAARGGATSGNALRALTEFGQNTASGEFNNWFNKRMDLADGGSRSAALTQQAGQNYATGYGNALQSQGDARASGIMGVTNALGQGLQGIGNAYLWGSYMNRSQQQPQYSQQGPYATGYRF